MHRNRAIRRTATAFTMLIASLPAWSGPAPAMTAGEAMAKPAAPALQTVALRARVAPQGTRPFSLVGVTWADPRVGVDGVVQVRTRALGAGHWGGWQTLEADGGVAGVRGATDPLWVGPSDAVEARVTGARRKLPAGLRVDLINPDVTNPDVTNPGVALPSLERAAVTMPARPVPRMVTRAGWGANEAIVKGAPEYGGPVQVFFVHHTATGNGYSCAQSASLVRGIQAYQVRSRGWDDIGYNFLVDRCGTVFEGRVGGAGRPVLGAHTLGFNDGASAIAVIGTYGARGVSATVRTAIATVAAYKLGAYGNAPNGRVVVASGGSDRFPVGKRVVLSRVSGHRDTGRTDCPGDALYAQLPAIRAIAGAAPAGLRLLRVGGATKYGSVLYSRGLIKPLWTVRTPSALIDRFEVSVDGKLILAAPGAHRGALLRLAPGGHTVTVRALHLSGRATTVRTTVVSDATAPVFSGRPDVVLRPGSLNGSVPIRLNWTATDVNGVAAVGLLRPGPVNLGTTAHGRNGTVAPGVPATFALRATDRAGNAANASVTRTPVVVSEAASQRTGVWRAVRNPSYLGGVALRAGTGGSTASWSFTGRSAALAVSPSALGGRIRIFVDGRDQGVVDLRSADTRHRQAIWARSWPAKAEHTVRVEAVTTTARPAVVLDGLVYLR